MLELAAGEFPWPLPQADGVETSNFWIFLGAGELRVGLADLDTSIWKTKICWIFNKKFFFLILSNEIIKTKFRAWHHWTQLLWDIYSCAKFCSDLIVRNWVMVDNINIETVPRLKNCHISIARILAIWQYCHSSLNQQLSLGCLCPFAHRNLTENSKTTRH